MTGAELSSIGTALEELTRRLTGIAEAAVGTEADWIAQELFEVERSLLRARRQLSTVSDKVRRPARD
ncbi:MAG: hypothetical protein ACRD0Q_08440 [Acidimicrobiales bacterium]